MSAQADSPKLGGDDARTCGQKRTTWPAGGMGRREEGSPSGVCADEDLVFVADPEAHCVRKFTSAGTLLDEWGERGDDQGQFDSPEALACDGRGGVYVADTGNHRIQKFTRDGHFVAAWGIRGPAAGCFDEPIAIVADADGGVWVCESGNRRVQHLWSSGSFLRFLGAWGSRSGGDPGLQDPQGIAIDCEGRVLVVDASSRTVRVYDGDGVLVRAIDLSALADGRVAPRDVAVGPAGEVYVCDTAGCLVHGFGADGASLGSWAVARGHGVQARRRSAGFPCGLATDKCGRLYVTVPRHGVVETVQPL